MQLGRGQPAPDLDVLAGTADGLVEGIVRGSRREGQWDSPGGSRAPSPSGAADGVGGGGWEGAGVVEELLVKLRDARGQVAAVERRTDEKIEQIELDLSRMQSASNKAEQEKEREKINKLLKIFQHIELRVAKLEETGSRVGEHLLKLDRRRKLAVESIDILRHFASFKAARGDSLQDLPALFTSEMRIIEAASTAQKLRAVGEALLVGRSAASPDLAHSLKGPPSASHRPDLAIVVERVQLYCDGLETRLIATFDKASKHKANVAVMRQCARSLSQFQGGGRLVSHYLASRPIFLEASSAALQEEMGAGGKGGQRAIDLLSKWYKHCLESVKKEAAVIRDVFPNPSAVADMLVQRVFEQNVQTYLGLAIGPAARGGEGGHAEALDRHLRNLAQGYQKTEELAAGLRSVGCSGVDVDALADEAFQEHLGGYPDLEFDLLLSLHGEAYAAQRGGGMNLNVLNTYLSWAAEAVARCKLLLPEDHFNETVLALFHSGSPDFSSERSLLDQAHKYLATGLEDAVALSRQKAGSLGNPSEADLPRFPSHAVGEILAPVLTAVRTVSKIVADFHRAVHGLVASLVDSEDTQAQLDSRLALFCGSLEGCVSLALGQVVAACASALERALRARQRKADYRPAADDAASVDKATPACVLVEGFLRSSKELCSSELSKGNAVAFMEDLGACLYDAIRRNMAHFAFSPQGALRFKRELSAYAAALKRMGGTRAAGLFSGLGTRVNLLVVMPESVVDLVRDDLKIPGQEAIAMARLREDYKTAKVNGESFDHLLAGI